jgi:hypothetical protein
MLSEEGYSVDHHSTMRSSLKTGISVIKNGRITSGLKSISAKLFLGLSESSFICEKNGMRKIFYKEE